MANVKRTGIVLGVIVAVLLIGFFVVQHLLDPDTYRSRIEATLSDALARPVQLGHLELSLFSGSLVANSPSIADDPAFGQQPFLVAKDVRIGVEMSELLFHRQLQITGFTIDEPKIMLIRREDGTWNYSSIGNASKRKAPAANAPENNVIPNLTVGKVDIKNGSLTVGTLPQQGQPHLYSDLNISAQNVSFTKAFPFTVSGKLPNNGTLDISGNAGPLNLQDASLSPLTAQITMKNVDLVATGFITPEQGIAGIADLDTKIVSDGATANADGTLQMKQLKLAKNGSPSSQPVNLKFSVSQDLKALSGKINSANLQIAKAALALTGTYQTTGNITTLQTNVNGQNMPIDDLVAFLPSLGVQLPPGARLQGGTLTLNLAVRGPSTAPTITGPVRIANTQLAGFDLGSKLSSIKSLTGAKTGSNTVIQALSTDLTYDASGTRTDNLAIVVSGLGSASGSGAVNAGGALNYRLLVKLDASSVSGVASQAMSLLPSVFGSTVSQATKNGIPLTIGGTTANPSFSVDTSKLVGGALNGQGSGTKSSNPIGKAIGGLGGLFGKH